MKSAYLYPISTFMDEAVPNEYIGNFMESLESNVDFLNKNRPSNKGILDLLKYYRRVDAIFLNWIEDLPDKRGGVLQTIFFILLVYTLKIRKVKMVWVLHNKISHYHTRWFLKKLIFNTVKRKSDLVITHSTEGLQFLEQHGVDIVKKAKYFPHPLIRKTLPAPTDRTIDILIWGSMIPYKGVDNFLRFLHENNLGKRYHIQMAGKVSPPDYEKTIREYCNDFIHLDSRYVPVDELEQYMANSKAVLFTYAEGSVLSSGALMESLSYGLNVLAPDVGAFKDAREEGLINTFNGFNELMEKLDDFINSAEDISDRIDQFIKENDWSQFAKSVIEWMNENG